MRGVRVIDVHLGRMGQVLGLYMWEGICRREGAMYAWCRTFKLRGGMANFISIEVELGM